MDYSNKTTFIFSNEFIGFTTIPNYIFQCSTISYKAIGLYCSILQYQNSPGHKISIRGLQALHTDGETSIANGLKELIEAGFITREQIRENGRVNGFLYTVYMKPIQRETLDNTGISPERENPDTVEKVDNSPELENHDTVNHDRENHDNKKENIKNKNNKKITTTTKEQKDVVVQEQKDLIVQELNGIQLADDNIETLLKIADVETIIDKIKILHTQSNVHNVLGFLISAIKNDYQQAKYSAQNKQTKQNKFVNYEQRDWDFDELKKLEREYVKRKLQQ